jgi:hypothetical protein
MGLGTQPPNKVPLEALHEAIQGLSGATTRNFGGWPAKSPASSQHLHELPIRLVSRLDRSDREYDLIYLIGHCL